MNYRSTLALASLLLLAGTLTAQTNARNWTPLAMDRPKSVQFAIPIGPKASTDVLHLAIGLPYRDSAGIQNFVDAVSDPTNPHYRQFITPDEVGKRFGLSAANVKMVSDYLQSQGMKIKLVAKNRLAILADATVAQAQAAFNTTIQEFALPNPGLDPSSIRFSYTSAPSVPATIGRFVTMVGGLENFIRPKPHGPLTPDQLRVLYSVAPIYKNSFQGQGRTVGISNWDGYQLSNIPLEYANFNLPTPASGAGSNVTVVSIDGQNGGAAPPEGEGDIDIQTTLAMAPLCNLIIYDDGGANTEDLIGVLTQEADDNAADIITESYGWPSGATAEYVQAHSIHQSMSAQGITYMCAAGDTGADGVPGYPYPDEDPEVLIVGGTSVTTDGLGNRQAEVVWNNSIGAGGGGWSQNSDPFNVLPAYQKGYGVPTNIPYRLIPDVSLDADPETGYEIFMGGALEAGWGGTSCASPTTAGSLADSEQQLIAAGALTANVAGKQRFGRIQDLLYSYNGDPTVFYDITSGNNGTLPNGNASNAGPGWDTASGWGTLNFNGLVDKVLGIPVPEVFTISPKSVVGGSKASGTITINLPAPAKGIVVSLSSNSPLATVPSTVTVSPGATTVSFTINTIASTSPGTATITALAAGVSLNATISMSPIGLVSLTISPSQIVGGNYSIGTVKLNGPAPAGGLDISLSSSNSAVQVAQHVEIASGANSDTFSIATTAVTSATTGTVTGTYGANSSSATITVGPASFSGISVSPTSVPGGTSATGTVSMNGFAPTGGLAVNLSSNNSAVSMPTTATIPAGASSTTFTVSTTAVAANTTVTLTATQGSTVFTTALTVTAANLSAITLSPASVIGGSASIATITLTGPVAGNAVTVKLTSNNSNAVVPAGVTVPVGASSATFTITTSPVSSSASATITGTQGPNTQTASLSIAAASLTSITVSPSSVGGGSNVVGTVTLNGTAGPGGTVISIASSSSNAIVPASVTIPAGATSTNFTVATSSAAAPVTATITATQGANTQTASLTINPATLSSFIISPNSVIGGASANGTVSLNGPAPTGGMTVALSSNASGASVPTSVAIPAGGTSTSFTIGTSGVTSTVAATISATQGVTTLTAGLTVQSPLLQALSLSTSSIVGGNSVTGTVTLARPAGSGGTIVAIASSNVAAQVPSSVTVASGSTTATFTITTSGVSTLSTPTITASLSGTTKTATLGIQSATLSGMGIQPSEIAGGGGAVGGISLNGVAPAGGYTIFLSSNSSAVTVPATVKVAAGSSGVPFNVSTTPVSSVVTAVVTAKLGVGTMSSDLLVQPANLSYLSISRSSVVGKSTAVVTGLVTFNGGAAAAGVTVKLSSSNTKVATVPASIKLARGADTESFPITHLLVSSSQTVTITATYGGVTQTATLTVDPFEVSSLSISPASVTGGVGAIGIVSLNATPANPLSVKLSSGTQGVGVPATLTVPTNYSSYQFKVTTSAVPSSTTATISATYESSSQQAELTILPPALMTFAVTPVSVKSGVTTKVTGTVNLSGPAPAGGLVIVLISSDPSNATAPASLTIPAGKTTATFLVSHSEVTVQTVVSITATLGASSLTANLTLNP